MNLFAQTICLGASLLFSSGETPITTCSDVAALRDIPREITDPPGIPAEEQIDSKLFAKKKELPRTGSEESGNDAVGLGGRHFQIASEFSDRPPGGRGNGGTRG